ncbi:hypothetical protein K0U07_04270 [bacterium]|nr:hypothetical protein [bacterium]
MAASARMQQAPVQRNIIQRTAGFERLAINPYIFGVAIKYIAYLALAVFTVLHIVGLVDLRNPKNSASLFVCIIAITYIGFWGTLHLEGTIKKITGFFLQGST